jgi:acyl-coenzyme A synthetase/AMP-(fatty) acid ligase
MNSEAEYLKNCFASRGVNSAIIDVHTGRNLSYDELLLETSQLYTEWIDLGVKVGDVVIIAKQDRLRFAIAFLTAILHQIRVLPLDPLGNLSFELENVNSIKPKLIVFDDSTRVFAGNIESQSVQILEEYEVGALFLTSGTTATPKAVLHSVNSLIRNAKSFNELTRIDENIILYHILPMHYMAGLLNTLISPLLAGGTVIIGEQFGPQSVFSFWEKVAQYKVNTTWVSPTIADTIQRTRRSSLDDKFVTSLNQVFCGMAPLSEDVKRRFEETFGVKLQQSYGTCELMLISCQSIDDIGVDVGEPLGGVELSIEIDDEGLNELSVKTPFEFKGYFDVYGFSKPLRSQDGGVLTGDLAFIERNRLSISGRKKDLIIRGGRNVSPARIESVIGQVSNVKELAVVGVRHPFWGEKITAYVVLDDNVNEESVLRDMKRAASSLMKFEKPDQYIFRHALPRTASGKILKRLLADGK